MNRGLPPILSWGESLHRLEGSFLQSYPWASFQAALGYEVIWAKNEDWQWMGVVRQNRGIKYLFCPYGPATGWNAARYAMTSLISAGRELGVDFVRLEPQNPFITEDLVELGGQQIGEVDPQHTQVLDLTMSEEELRSRLTSGHRNLINGTQRRGITIEKMTNPEGLNHLLGMLKDTAARSDVTFYPDTYFRTMLNKLGLAVTIYVAKVNSDPVAAALFYDWDGTRYYAHAGAYQEKNRQAKASVSLVWQSIMDAKQLRMRYFDLWGVAPEDEPEHRLAALSKFKRAFGGSQENYAGTWDIALKPAKYQLYLLYRKLKGRQ